MRRLAISISAVVLSLLLGAPAMAAGDPGRGADYSWYRPSTGQLNAANVGFVARYLVPRSSRSGKALTAAEASTLLANGRTVVLNYEGSASGMQGGYAAGVRDAHRAELARFEVGAPALPIYFSADWDVTASQVPAVLAYLSGVSSVIGRARVGVYGGYRAVNAALNAGYPYAWQTYAWSRGRWDGRAQLRQVRNGALFGGQGDLNQAVSQAYGGWTAAGAITPALAARIAHQTGSQDSTRYDNVTAVYTVKRGDTLGAIAKLYHTTAGKLAALNGIRNANRISVGQRIRVNGTDSAVPRAAVVRVNSYTVRRGDTLASIARRFRTTVPALVRLNHIRNANRIAAGQRLRVH